MSVEERARTILEQATFAYICEVYEAVKWYSKTFLLQVITRVVLAKDIERNVIPSHDFIRGDHDQKPMIMNLNSNA